MKIEYKFEPIKFGIMKQCCSPGIYFNIIYNNICNGFWGLDLCISINTFSKSYFLSIKPIGQIRFIK